MCEFSELRRSKKQINLIRRLKANIKGLAACFWLPCNKKKEEINKKTKKQKQNRPKTKCTNVTERLAKLNLSASSCCGFQVRVSKTVKCVISIRQMSKHVWLCGHAFSS